MKILITGGAGFIGSAIVPAFQKQGDEVFVLDNLSFGSRKFIDVKDDHFFKVDIRDATKLNDAIQGIDPEVVIHLAAIHFIPYCNDHPFEAADTNIRGTLNLLGTCRNVKSLQKVLFASTAAVYPITNGAIPESNELNPMDIYGLSKLTGEHLFREFHLETGINTIICRFFNAFGPNETNPHLIPEIETQLREGKRTIRLGNLSPKRDFIHTYDMAEAVKSLIELENIKFDIFNLGRGIEYSVVEIVEAFERILNEKISIEVDASRVRKVEREHLLADVTKLIGATGWYPVWDIDEGINNLVESWRK